MKISKEESHLTRVSLISVERIPEGGGILQPN